MTRDGSLWAANQRLVGGAALAKLGDNGYMGGARGGQIRDDLHQLLTTGKKVVPTDLLAMQLDDRALYLERWQKVLLVVLSDQAVAQNRLRTEMRDTVRQWNSHASTDSAAICLNDTCTSGSIDPATLAFDCALHPERCVPTCVDDGDPKCPGYSLNPIIDKSDPRNQDQDDVSAKLLGRQVGEQMWINYYTEAGGFKSPVRLLNDATTGWNDKFSTDFYAPKDPGPFRVWALVHDNRGGVAWSGITLQAE